jgi:hypothetical protein
MTPETAGSNPAWRAITSDPCGESPGFGTNLGPGGAP